MSLVSALHDKAITIVDRSIRMTSLAGSGHPTSAMSLAHLVAYLMFEQMRYDPRNPHHPSGDRLVLSEGHAVPAVYAAYADVSGTFGRGELRPLQAADVDQLRALRSELDGHPNPAEGFPFFDAATGSLGQGLSVAAGLGLAARLDGSDRRIYALVGDGESREGQIWEAVDFLVDQKLGQVVTIFNCNGQGQAAPVSSQQSPERLAEKLRAFGMQVQVIDGHDPAAIAKAFQTLRFDGPPHAIVARTIKGWGVEALQQGNWHGKPWDAKKLDQLAPVVQALRGSLVHQPSAALSGPKNPPHSGLPRRAEPRKAAWPTLDEALRSAGLGGAIEKRALATRRAYGVALKVAGDLLPQVVCLDGDVSNSTFSEIFAQAHPDRFFECKIAEQNMVSAAVGLAAAGFIPFANSFAKFISRGYDQVELANITRANIKLVGSHSGITPCADGPSQMGLVDVAFFRALSTARGDDRVSPQCWFFQPSDAAAAYACTRLMLELRGLCYMRTHRPDVKFLYGPEVSFEPGGFQTPRAGSDVALAASGYMVHVALAAAELLSRQGIRAAVLDCYSLPIQSKPLREAARRAGGLVLTVEDNYGGGLHAEWAEIAARTGDFRVEGAFVQRFPKSAREVDEELEYCGVSAPQIADKALALLRAPA